MTDLRAQLESGLSGSYTLERELGRGGMATVFLAQDLKHDRPVALKVLHPQLAASLGPDRFLREIKLAARLQHPHILTVLDSGNAGGRLWFTMPFVEGESLRDRIRRERQLPVEDALRIAHEAARALDYAHQHGVIHRDIKPENILLTRDGSTLVADFGIARALETTGDDKLTETGLVVGTPAYMSPEQAAGDRSLDARTDVYSLAAVLYEMLAGEPPFMGATTQAMLVRRLTEPPPSVRTVRPNVPEGVDQAIRRSLSPVAADRFGTMAQLGQALQAAPTGSYTAPTPAAPAATAAAPAPAPTLVTPVSPAAAAAPPAGGLGRRRVPVAAGALVVGLLIGLGVLFAWRRGAERAGAPPSGQARLVVLPFENLGDSSDAYFAGGMSDAVRGKLTELSQLQVIARGSSVQYAGSTRTPAQIAADLGVQYLLTGTVRWAKNKDGTSRVQVSPELVQVGGDGAAASKWQQSFEAPISDVFKVQADIAGQVAQAMRVALPGAAQERLAEAPTKNPAAYDAFLRARAATNYGASNAPAALRQAISQYQEAVRLDSTFALAWAEMAIFLGNLYSNSVPTPETARQMRAAAERAIATDPRLSSGHRALGFYFLNIVHDLARATAQIDSAAMLAPGDALSLSARNNVAMVQGRVEEALGYARSSFSLDPRSAARALSVVQTLLYLRRPGEAKPIADQAIALAPTNPTGFHRRVVIALAEGDLAGARAVLARADKIAPADLDAYLVTYYDLGWVLDEAGQRLALSLGPEAYDDDKAQTALARAQLSGWRGDQAASRAWGDSAQREFSRQLRDAPNNAQLHALRGLALAYAGRRDEAVPEGERALALAPLAQNGTNTPYFMHLLVRIHIHTGQPEKAMDELEKLMAIPYFVTPAWLRIDPEFAPLHGNPRFERLAGGTA